MNNNKMKKQNTFRRFCLATCISMFTLALFAQGGIRVSGTISDTDGLPLPGVNVSVKGTTTGIVSDEDGKYAIQASGSTDVLVFSYIGCTTQEIRVGNQTSLDVVMRESSRMLDEVVVVGYGTQKKVNLTGAIATINAQEIQDLPVSNLSNAISGRLAGVTITQNYGGRPGNASSIAIRAKGSWNNTDPLYVIDGVVRDKFAFDGLASNDVESLSVLKDGASAAIYGSRAANGVVLVTTKKGTMSKPMISYVGSIGLSDATRIPERLNAYDLSQLINDRLIVEGVNASDPRYYTPDEQDYFKTHSYDGVEELWRQPLLSQHSLNVTGGNERIRYFVGGSYYYETGTFDNMKFQKYNLRSNLEANITKDLVVSLGLNMDLRNDRKPLWLYDRDNTVDDGVSGAGRSDTLYDLFGVILRYSVPFVPLYIDGLPVGNSMEMNAGEIIATHTGYNNRKYSNYEANVALEYKVPFVEGLKLKLLYNNYNRHQFTKHFNRPFPMYIFKTTGEHNHIITNEVAGTQTRNDGDWIRERYDNGNSYQLNGFVTYDRTFGKHDVSALFVFEQSEGTMDWFNAQRNYYISGTIDQFFAGSSDPKDSTVNGSGEEDGRQSYAGRVNYVYDSKYLFEANFRYDGSVRFAPSRRWGFFPSVSLGWRMSEENFFKDNIRFIDYLKLKGSIGLLGNDAVGGWQWMQRYNFTSGAQYGTASQGIQPNVLPNPDITWEKSLTYNAGFDANFLNNKLRSNFEFFYKHTYDVLGSRIATLPASFGANMPNENYGIVDSKGFEMELSYEDKVGDNFTYRIGGNFGYAINKLIRKDEAENLRAYRSEIGLNTDRSWGYIATDIIRTQAELDALPADYTIFGAKPELGMLNYQDLRGAVDDVPDGKIDSDDRVWVSKHTIPPVNYGFSLGANWKGLALDLFFQGVGKYDVMMTHRNPDSRNVNTEYDFWKDHWTPENPDAAFPRPYRHQAGEVSSFWLMNGAFLRLKNLTLSYSLPKSTLSKAGASQLKFFFVGTNLFLLEDHIKYFDPEIGNTEQNIKCFPIMKNYSLGVNISF